MKAFPWRRGMAIRRQGEIDVVIEVRTAADGTVRICWATDAQGVLDDGEEMPPAPYAPWGWVCASEVAPDPNDGATKGALLEAVREVYNDPHIGVSYETWIDGQNYWRVGLDYEHPCGRAELGTDPDSEFAALEAAWQAAP